MSILWRQVAWYEKQDKRGGGWGNKAPKPAEKKCWKWQGQRSDGRSFRVTYIAHLPKPFVCQSFNGAHIGSGTSLAEAQKHATMAPGVSVPVKVAA